MDQFKKVLFLLSILIFTLCASYYGLSKQIAINECTSYKNGIKIFDQECFESKGY